MDLHGGGLVFCVCRMWMCFRSGQKRVLGGFSGLEEGSFCNISRIGKNEVRRSAGVWMDNGNFGMRRAPYMQAVRRRGAHHFFLQPFLIKEMSSSAVDEEGRYFGTRGSKARSSL